MHARASNWYVRFWKKGGDQSRRVAEEQIGLQVDDGCPIREDMDIELRHLPAAIFFERQPVLSQPTVPPFRRSTLFLAPAMIELVLQRGA